MAALQEYPQYALNLPFENGDDIRLKFIITTSLATDSEIRSTALDHYITHYFPEFYINVIEGTSFSGDTTDYNDLRDLLANRLQIENPGFPTKPPSGNQIVITRLNLGRDIYQMRDEWELASRLPDFQTNLEFFNARHGIGANVVSQTEIDLHTITTDAKAFGSVMESFNNQMNNYNGAVPIGGLNFTTLDNTVQQILNITALEITKDIETATGSPYRGTEGDMMTLYFSLRTSPPFNPDLFPEPDDPLGIFNNHIALNGIVYFSAEAMVTDFFKVGYFSLIKYKPQFTDQITLKTLQNYHELLRKNADYSSSGNQFPMFEFLSETLPEQIARDDATDNFFSFPTENDRDNGHKSALEKEAIRLGLIDVNDTDELQQGIRALTSEEMAELKKEVAKNPELYEKVYQEEKKKKLKTGLDIADTIERAMQTGPLAVIKKGSAVDRILGQLGIKALAKEALICLTFGVNIEAARITAVIGNVLEEELNERPPTDPTQFDLFKIKGDLGKQILDIILNSLKSTLMSIIKGLADLLREVCNLNNPRASDFGATDIASLPPNNFAGAENPFGFGNDDNSPLGDLIDMLGMLPEDIYKYLTDISQILSSIDICILLTDIASASDELINRIIDFNKNYADTNISTKLIEISPVIEFWTLLGNVVDVTDLCNEILTDLSLLNQDNICLDVSELDPQEQNNIDELLDLIENGFQQPPPVFSFDCPDAENYINDPVMTKLIPETLSTMVELVEMQFIYSVDSIKNVLLEPVLTSAAAGSATGNSLYDMVVAGSQAGPDSADNPENFPELPKPNKQVMKAIGTALDKIRVDPGGIRDALEVCLINQPDLLAPGLRNIGEAINALLDILGDPEVEAALSNIANKMDILSSAPEGVPIISSYLFNENFYNNFINYINIDASDFVETSEQTTRITDIQTQIQTLSALLADPSQMPFSSPRTLAYLENNIRLLEEELNILSSQKEIFTIKEYFKSYTLNNETTSHIEFSFPRFNSTDERQVIDIPYPEYGTPTAAGPPTFNLSALFDEETAPLFGTEIEGTVQGTPVSYTMDPFVEAAVTAPDAGLLTTDEAAQTYFPYAYGILADQVFDYYIENGVFDAASLQSLNFFHDNANCSAESISDLLDVDGIFKQMQQEYLEEACNNDAPTPRERMREVIKFGMFLLLVQVHIAEFVIKNVFVFAALQLDELFGKEFVTSYMSAQVNASIESYFANTIDRELVDRVKDSLIVIFNRIIVRPNIVAEGGITDMDGVVIFPTGTIFEKEGHAATGDPNIPTANFNDIIDFVALYRIQSSMGTAPGVNPSRPGPVSNALQNMLPISNQKSMEGIFLASMPVVATSPELIMPGMNEYLGPWTGALSSELSETRLLAGLALNDTLATGSAEAGLLGDIPGSAPAKAHIVVIKSVALPLPTDALAETASMAGDAAILDDNNSTTSMAAVPLPTGSPSLAPGEHMHMYTMAATGDTDWTVHQDDADIGDGVHNPSGAYLEHTHPGQSHLGPSVPGPASGPAGSLDPYSNMITTAEETDTTTGLQDLADSATSAPATESRINYEFWMYIPDATAADLNDSGTQRTAIKLFETAPLDFYGDLTGSVAVEAERYNAAITYHAVNGGPTPVLKTEEELKDDILRSYSLSNPTEIERSNLSEVEMEHILADPTYQDYFTNVFSQEIIGILPIVHNFYLTNHYFGEIRQAMRSTKNRVLEILNSTIENHNNYNSLPDLTRPGARQASLTTDGPDGDEMARDFILKMIIKTPIDIIKGLMQLIDPHVIVSKFIKKGTADAFSVIGGALSGLDLPSPDDNNSANPLAPFAPGATGEDLFYSVLCLLEWLISNPDVGPAATAKALGFPTPENFFPRIDRDGVDLLGTGMGMLMIPPTPFGLIYLLLSLINFDHPPINVDVGVNYGSGYIQAGTQGPGACDDLPAGEAAEDSPEPEESVRPPYADES
tara:strand:- start:9721 stop:15573 length:5853 start_codon:yes stop_codon:yes gene_type:complete